MRLPAPSDGSRPLVGVVHLLALPGGPHRSPGLPAVIARARADAAALASGGADGIIVENLGDAPFEADEVEPYTVAAMTRVVCEVLDAAPQCTVGVNVLRNDARSALAIAAATGATFVRVNVHVGAMVTDQGVLQGRARQTLLDRRRLGADVGILADVHVKHAAPLGDMPLTTSARDTWSRGGADGLILTGTGTGQPTDPATLQTVAAAVPTAPLWIGSGLTPETAGRYDAAHGAIVGTWLHRDADLRAPLDPERVGRMAAAWKGR